MVYFETDTSNPSKHLKAFLSRNVSALLSFNNQMTLRERQKTQVCCILALALDSK